MFLLCTPISKKSMVTNNKWNYDQEINDRSCIVSVKKYSVCFFQFHSCHTQQVRRFSWVYIPKPKFSTPDINKCAASAIKIDNTITQFKPPDLTNRSQTIANYVKIIPGILYEYKLVTGLWWKYRLDTCMTKHCTLGS